jgi:hypothetical protein
MGNHRPPIVNIIRITMLSDAQAAEIGRQVSLAKRNLSIPKTGTDEEKIAELTRSSRLAEEKLDNILKSLSGDGIDV